MQKYGKVNSNNNGGSQVDRRELLKILGLVPVATILPGCMAWMRPRNCISYNFSLHQEETMKALADTVIPYDGEPGAVEAGAWQVLKDPFYGVNPWIAEIVSDADWAAQLRYHTKNFKSCDLAQRTVILEDLEKNSLYKVVYGGVIAFSKLAFFGGLINQVGFDYIGFPGKSRGYLPNSQLVHESCK